MLTITPSELFAFSVADQFETHEDYVAELTSNEEETVLDKATFDGLKACDVKIALASQEMSCEHMGGDDVIGYVDDAMNLVKEGYKVVTWYGPKTEALVAGYRESELFVVIAQVAD